MTKTVTESRKDSRIYQKTTQDSRYMRFDSKILVSLIDRCPNTNFRSVRRLLPPLYAVEYALTGGSDLQSICDLMSRVLCH